MGDEERVYSAAEIANIVNLATKNVRRNIKKMGIQEHSTKLVFGNETSVYHYQSLPREWRFKIDDYEHEKERELWENVVPPPEKLALNNSATQQAEAALKQYQLDHAKTIQDQWERKQYFMVLFNSVRGPARETAYAKDSIIRACKEYLRAKGFENLGGAWNYKAVQEFCAAYVAGEIDIPEEHARIISRKGKRSLTATSLLKWREGERGTAQVAAMLQIARRNRGEAGEAATDTKSFFSHLVSYRKQFAKAGLNIYDFIDLKSGKFKKGQDIDTFFEALRSKTKGGSAAMLKSIGIEDYETSNFMAGLMKDWEDYKKIRDDALSGAGQDVVEKDFNEVMKTDWARLKRLEIDKSKAMKSAGSSEVVHNTLGLGNWALENPGTAGTIALGSYAAWKMAQRYLGKKGFDAIGASLPGGGGVPVTVTNFPPGLKSPGSHPPGPGGLPNKQPGLKNTPWFSGSIGALPAVGTAVVGYTSIEIGKYLAEREARSTSTKRLLELRGQHMVMGGGENSYQVKLINQELARRDIDPNKPVQNNIALNIQIDGQGRTFVVSDDMKTRTEVKIKRGNFFGTESSYMPSH